MKNKVLQGWAALATVGLVISTALLVTPSAKHTPKQPKFVAAAISVFEGLKTHNYKAACVPLKWYYVSQNVDPQYCAPSLSQAYKVKNDYIVLGWTQRNNTQATVTISQVIDNPNTKRDEVAICDKVWLKSKYCKYATAYTLVLDHKVSVETYVKWLTKIYATKKGHKLPAYPKGPLNWYVEVIT